MQFNEFLTLKLNHTLADDIFDKVYEYISSEVYDSRCPEPYEISQEIGIEWIVQKGRYTGTWPKRFMKWLKAEHGVHLYENHISVIGSMVKDATIEESEYVFDFTKNFDWDAGDFGDSNSCYWNSKARAKSIIAENHGFAFRLYEKKYWGSYGGCGRVWVLPVEIGEETVYVIWNAYGKSLSFFAKLFSEYLQKDYHFVNLSNQDTVDGVVWINDSAGFMIGSMDIIKTYAHFDLALDEGDYCVQCGASVDEDSPLDSEGRLICETCFDNDYTFCADCGEIISRRYEYVPHGMYYSLCSVCIVESHFRSDYSYEYYHVDDLVIVKVEFTQFDISDTVEYKLHVDEVEIMVPHFPSIVRSNKINKIEIDGKSVEFELFGDGYYKNILLKEGEFSVVSN